jgi:hypothetical protein
MAQPVVHGDMLMCPMGAAPSPITVLPTIKTMAEKKPMATIMDNVAFLNIMPFGTCMSLANPATATLTAAAFGVLTPGPCTPMTPAPWMPGAPTVLIGGKPALNSTSKCSCVYGGVISVSVPTAVTETVP